MPVKVATDASNPLEAVNTASSVAMIAAQSTGAMLDVGMGVGGSMSMGALGLLMGSGAHKQPYEYSQIVAFMPKDFAPSKQSANLKLYHQISHSLSLIKDYTFKESDGGTYYQFFGHQCDSMTICSISFSYPLPVSSTALSWASKPNDYIWGYGSAISPVGIKTRIKKGNKLIAAKNIVDSAKLYTALSLQLPSWIYIYVAPNMDKKTPAYFLNQGKVLPFIKPLQD